MTERTERMEIIERTAKTKEQKERKELKEEMLRSGFRVLRGCRFHGSFLSWNGSFLFWNSLVMVRFCPEMVRFCPEMGWRRDQKWCSRSWKSACFFLRAVFLSFACRFLSFWVVCVPFFFLVCVPFFFLLRAVFFLFWSSPSLFKGHLRA